MNTLFHPVNSFLETHVREILVTEDMQPGKREHVFRYFADGCPGIIFQVSESGLYSAGHNRMLPQLFLYGQTVRPVTMTANGPFRMIVFLLQPAAVFALFGIHAAEITDTCLDMTLLPGLYRTALLDRLENASSGQEQVDILRMFISDLTMHTDVSANSGIDAAVQAIHHRKGDISLKELQERLHLTERTFQRRFEQHVGIPPRLYARISRFQQALRQFQHADYDKLSDIAYANGYNDQSHFIRTFREFTDTTPLEYQRSLNAGK